jgi:hypothetical protein
MSRTHIRSRFIFITIFSTIWCAAGWTINAQVGPSGPEQILFESANRERAAQGLAPLKWSAALASAAHAHAVRMAQQNTLSHQLPGEPGFEDRASRAGAHFSSVAENIAEGPNAEVIHQEWMHSPPHRANLMDPQLDSLGIAVVERQGTLFAVEDFSLAVETLTIPEQEKMVAEQLQKRGLRMLNYTDDARESCLLDNGYAGSHRPSFVLHYATAELASLPDMLEQRIKTGRYHSAVVGACTKTGKTAFAGYRIAVLFYE